VRNCPTKKVGALETRPEKRKSPFPLADTYNSVFFDPVFLCQGGDYADCCNVFKIIWIYYSQVFRDVNATLVWRGPPGGVGPMLSIEKLKIEENRRKSKKNNNTLLIKIYALWKINC
jgi:hypothetical protein